MKSVSISITRVLALVALAALCAAGAGAQTKGGRERSRDEHLISARAGGVNQVSGVARFRPEGAAEWRRLTTDETLAAGDTVATDAFSQVEVLLNPGAYFRLGENSEFTLSDDSLDSLRLTLTRGSAVVEAVGFDQLKVSILVDTPHTRVEVVRSGLYRVNVLPAGVTEVAVFKGRAMVGRAQALKVKGGKVARVGGAGVEEVKLDKEKKDSLDLWSRERGEALAKINEKLQRRTVNALLANVSWNDAFSGPVGGLWFFNSGTRCWVFLPGSGYGHWSSPYGDRYSNMLYFNPFGSNCHSCNGNNSGLTRHHPYGNPYGGAGVVSNGGGGTGTGNGGGHVAPPPQVAPQPPPMAPPREFVRPAMEAPRERVAMPTRDQ